MSLEAKTRKDYAILKRLLAKTPKVVEHGDLEHQTEVAQQFCSLTEQLNQLDTIENTEAHTPGFGLALLNAISTAARSQSEVDLLGAAISAGVLLSPSDGSRVLAIALVRGDIFAVLARGCASVARRPEPAGPSDSGSSGRAGSGAGGGSGGPSGRGAGGSDGGSGSPMAALRKLGSYFDTYEFVMVHLREDLGKNVWAELHGALRRSSFLEHAAAALLRTAADLNSMQQPVGVQQQQQQQQPQHPPAPQPKQQDQQQVAMWRQHAGVATLFLYATLSLTRLTGLTFDELCASTRRYRLDQVFDADHAAAQAAHAAELRELVSGPGLRALLLACLTPSPFGEFGASLVVMRWPAKVATRTDVAGGDVRLLSLQVATRVFQATVSGRCGAVPVAQPPCGYVNTCSQGCALWPQQQPQTQQEQQQEQQGEGGQQRTADKLRMQTAAACAAVAVYFEQVRFAHFCITTTQGDHPTSVKDAAISGEDWARTVPAVRLLVRLLPEMGTRGAVGRLPGMWARLVAAVTPRLLEPEVPEEDAMGLLADAGLLLRLQIDWRGNLLPLAPLQPMPVAADTAAAQPFGHCPSLSLRLALEAGLLPALERLLRAAFVEQPAAAGGGQAARQEVLERRARIATCAVGCLLLTSGVFPALLAHAPVAELVPLLATLACVQRRLAAASHTLRLRKLTDFASVLPAATSTPTEFSVGERWAPTLTALAQQVRVVLEWTASAPPHPQPPAIHLWLWRFPIDVRWLAAAGGAPPPGLAAAVAQQRRMQSLMCLWWAPAVMPVQMDFLLNVHRFHDNEAGSVLSVWLECALETLHLQLCVCRACARAHLAYWGAHEEGCRAGGSGGVIAGDSIGSAGNSSGSPAVGTGGNSETASEVAAGAAAQCMEVAMEEWRLRVADRRPQMERLYEAVFTLLSLKPMRAAEEAEVRKEAARREVSSGNAAAANSAAGAGIATGSSGSGSSGGGFRLRTVGELLASTGTALLDLIEQDTLCAALAWREQTANVLGPAVGTGPSTPPAPSQPPPPPYVLVPAAARAVLYKYGGLAQRPAMESLLLPLQGPGEEEVKERAWACPFLDPPGTTSQQVTAEAAAYQLLQSALAEHREEARVAEAAEAAGSQPQPLSQQPRRGSDASSRAWLVLSCVPERLACAMLEEDVQQRQAAAESARATTAGAQEEEQAEVVDVKRKGAVVAHSKVCCNPACTSLGGPSALIAPGCGKTCVRCKAVTYCCGACQLAHWGAAGGEHSRVCPKLAALLS